MALERFDEQITCPVCLEQYTEPKLLQCHHVYCKDCLEGLLKRAADKTVLVCPTCRKETPVPQESGVSGLGVAFHIDEMMELRDSLLSEMSSMVSRTSSMVSRTSRTSSVMSRAGSIASSIGTCGGSSLDPSMGQEVDKPRQLMCPHHKGYELQLYCESCDEVLCVKCTIREHNGHEYKLVEDVVGKHKLVMVHQMEEVNDMAGKIKKTLMTVDEELENLRLVHQRDKRVARKLKSLVEERAINETILLRANSCVQEVEEALNTKSDIEILLLRKTLMQRLQENMSLFHQGDLKASAEVELTALMIASLNGNTEDVEVLLRRGAEIDSGDNDGRSALELASGRGHIDIVRLLLKHGAHLDWQDNEGCTPLMVACCNGHKEMASFLIDSGASMQLKNYDGKTAYDFALEKNYTDILQFFTKLRTNSSFPGILFSEDATKESLTSSAKSINLENVGISLSIPEDALPSTDPPPEVQIQPCFSGPWEVPENLELVSPAYIVEPSREVVFRKEVLVKIRHHANLETEEDCKNMVFLSASTTPEYRDGRPVYVFQEIAGVKGLFRPKEKQPAGEIALKNFCILGIFRYFFQCKLKTKVKKVTAFDSHSSSLFCKTVHCKGKESSRLLYVSVSATVHQSKHHYCNHICPHSTSPTACNYMCNIVLE